MASRFADSVGHYATVDVIKKWTNEFNAGATVTNAAPAGRAATNALFMGPTLGGGSSVTKTLDYQNGWTVGFAMYLIRSTNGIGGTIYTLMNNGSALGLLIIQPDSTISFQIGSVTRDFPPLTINPNQWYYYEIQTTTAPAGANIGVTVNIRINGVSILTMSLTDSGIAMSATLHGDSTANRHAYSTGGGANGGYMCDFYVLDNTGGVNDTFLGDVTVSCLFPDADNGVNFSIFPTTPTTHYTKVNDNPPDYDTTYIYSDTISQTDDFLWQHIPTFTGTIPFVHYGLYARKDDEGTRTIQHTKGGTPYTPIFSIGDNYLYYFVPDDGPWTVATFNAEDFGVEIKA